MNTEASAAKWYSDVDMDDCFFNQWELSALNQLDAEELAVSLGQELQQPLSSESYTSCPSYQLPASAERPKKMLKTSSWTSCISEPRPNPGHDGTTPRILTFGNPDPQNDQLTFYNSYTDRPAKTKKEIDASKRKYDSMNGHGHKSSNMSGRQGPQNKEHIMAERKRREKLSQCFVALSAVVPGLKKMDKASVLGDAIKYLKQLEEKVKALEDQAAQRTVESAVLIKKSQLCADEDISSCDDNSDGRGRSDFLPEIEAKMSEKTVLLKIHCENRKGTLVKVLSEIEKLNLSVGNISVVPFASSSDIIVMAQTEEDFSMTVKDLVKNLNSVFRQFI